MLKYKDIKQKYKKNFQRAKFNGVKKYKKLTLCRIVGRVNLISTGKSKGIGKQMLAAHHVMIRYLKKRKVHVWSRVYADFANHYKTKGVRMGGGRGKHFRFKFKYRAGEHVFETCPRGS